MQKLRSIPEFTRVMTRRHPELAEPVGRSEMERMAARDGFAIRMATLPAQQKARAIRLWDRVYIQINRSLAPGEQLLSGMHELCHLWRDDPGIAAYYSDDVTGGEACEFADIFAWYVTSPARPFYDPTSAQIGLPF